MKVLLTGASGIVGRLLRPYLALDYKTVLLNSRTPITDLSDNELYQQGDICKPEVVYSLVSQVDGIIHMAGLVGPDYTFEQCLDPNFVSVYHLFEACRKYNVKRIIYASTHHAIGFLERGAVVDHNTPPRADSWYGITKACGEIVSAYAADKYGLDVMSIRIGYVENTIPDERRIHTWCSPRDLASLIKIGLTGPQKGFHMVYGLSNCPEPMFDNSSAHSLGFKPLDYSLKHLADQSLASHRRNPENPDEKYIGGHFPTRKIQ